MTAAATEAGRKPGEPVLTRTLHGQTWRFGTPDIRPSPLRRYAVLAGQVAGKKPDQISDGYSLPGTSGTADRGPFRAAVTESEPQANMSVAVLGGHAVIAPVCQPVQNSVTVSARRLRAIDRPELANEISGIAQ